MRVKNNRQEIVIDYIAEISDKLVIKGSIKRPMPLNRLGMLLKKTGYKDVRRGPQRVRGWYVYERTSDEINANRNKKEDI